MKKEREYVITEADRVSDNDVCEFLKKEWSRRICLSDQKFYQWQFKKYSGSDGANKCLLVVEKDSKRIQGFIGLNPRTFYLLGSPLQGAELTTWIFTKKIRGKGYAEKIISHLQNEYQILLAMGITDIALHIYKRFGFKYLRAIPRYYKIYNIETIKEIAQISPLGTRLIKSIKIKPKDLSSKTLDASCLKTTTQNLYNDYNCFSRSWIDVKWRFFDHPYYKYKTYCINPDSDKPLILIVRVEEHPSVKLCHVMEFFGNPKNFIDALQFIDKFCLDNNIDFCDFYCCSDRITSYFWANGWFSTLNDVEIQIPHLFNPIEMRTPPTTSLIFWSKNNIIELANLGKLYVTKSDCDLDRPTIEYLTRKNLLQKG